MTVVKVGGSLYDHPGLGSGLRAWLAGIDDPILLVPGGGKLADVIRSWDRIHRLGDELCHELAVRAMAIAGGLLGTIPDCEVFDCESVLDEADLPRSWAVTSDSIAAHVAGREGASRLVLLKSIDVSPGTPWSEASANGWVDTYFPIVVARLACPVEVLNFRRWLDGHGYGK